MAAVKLHT